jgi:hypothetical protein
MVSWGAAAMEDLGIGGDEEGEIREVAWAAMKGREGGAASLG